MIESSNLPIGIFDSGMGGLTVLHELKKQLPDESFLYLGDTARLPYGTKSQATVLHYASRKTALLVARGIKLLVIACNTATTAALPHLRAQYPDLPIIGVVEPGAKAAIAATKNNHIALLATEATIHSKIYYNTLMALKPKATISTQPCGLFVALAEEGCTDDQLAACAVERYLTPLIKAPNLCDTVILGCTHFPVLIQPITRFLNKNVSIINSAEATASTAKDTLTNLNLLVAAKQKSHSHYLVTDLPERFCRVGETFLQHTIDANNVELIDSHQAIALEN